MDNVPHCKMIEDMMNDERIIIAVKLLKRGKESFEEIAEDSGFSLEDVMDLAEQLNIVPA